jgi:hypothetical protein
MAARGPMDHKVRSTSGLGEIDGGRGEAMASASLERSDRGELARIQKWRLEELLRAGYALPDALEIAVHTEVDLHRATSLVERGCPSSTAVRIVI